MQRRAILARAEGVVTDVHGPADELGYREERAKKGRGTLSRQGLSYIGHLTDVQAPQANNGRYDIFLREAVLCLGVSPGFLDDLIHRSGEYLVPTVHGAHVCSA